MDSKRRNVLTTGAPKSEVSLFPWKEPTGRMPLAVRQARSFLRTHAPVAA